MPLSESQRRTLADKYIRVYFPHATPEQTEDAIERATLHFAGDSSPIKDEQDYPGASGTGATFRQYVIYMARNSTDQEPINVTAEELDTLLRRINSM